MQVAKAHVVTHQWRLQGQAYPGIARVFLHTIYHNLSKNVLRPRARARMYTVSVDVTWHVAMDYGGVESTSRASRHEESTVKPEYLVVFCV